MVFNSPSAVRDAANCIVGTTSLTKTCEIAADCTVDSASSSRRNDRQSNQPDGSAATEVDRFLF